MNDESLDCLNEDFAFQPIVTIIYGTETHLSNKFQQSIANICDKPSKAHYYNLKWKSLIIKFNNKSLLLI